MWCGYKAMRRILLYGLWKLVSLQESPGFLEGDVRCSWCWCLTMFHHWGGWGPGRKWEWEEAHSRLSASLTFYRPWRVDISSLVQQLFSGIYSMPGPSPWQRNQGWAEEVPALRDPAILTRERQLHAGTCTTLWRAGCRVRRLMLQQLDRTAIGGSILRAEDVWGQALRTSHTFLIGGQTLLETSPI